MAFRVGMKVVCVDVSPSAYGRVPLELVKGRIYTITGFEDADCDDDIGVFLAEVSAFDDEDDHTDAFKASRFRPIAERKTDISIFTAMLNTSKQGIEA